MGSPTPNGERSRALYRHRPRVADAGAAVPFAIVLLGDGAVVGSTRSWNLERWPWPKKHLQNGQVFSMCVTSVPGRHRTDRREVRMGFFAPIGWPPTTLLAIRLVFSILAEECPVVKQQVRSLLDRA